jgi:hypothetical protein
MAVHIHTHKHTHTHSLSLTHTHTRARARRCVWDDRSAMFGDRRPLVLHYYLEDGSVEVNEQHARNTGRDPAPGFVKRAPLPKVGGCVGGGAAPMGHGREACIRGLLCV